MNTDETLNEYRRNFKLIHVQTKLEINTDKTLNEHRWKLELIQKKL